MVTKEELDKLATGALIEAAEKHAAAYDGDDRECIKADVMNAFYAGAEWASRSDGTVDGRAILRKLVTALDGKRAAGIAGDPGFEFNDQLWALLEPARAALAQQATTASAQVQHHALCEQKGHNPLCGGCEAEHAATTASASGEATELVAAIRDRVARIRYIDESSRKLLIRAADMIENAAPAQADDARDAARYRWLRNPETDVSLVIDKRTGFIPPVEGVPGVGGYHTYEYRAGDELDAAIDAAMSASQGKEGEKE